MAKAISSASEFLTAVAGKTKLFEVEGATVELRSLEWAETEMLYAQYGDKPAEMTYQTVLLGVKTPTLNTEQLNQLRKALPGAIQKISSEIMAISGMGAAASGGPLGGNGSSLPLATDQPS